MSVQGSNLQHGTHGCHGACRTASWGSSHLSFLMPFQVPDLSSYSFTQLSHLFLQTYHEWLWKCAVQLLSAENHATGVMEQDVSPMQRQDIIGDVTMTLHSFLTFSGGHYLPRTQTTRMITAPALLFSCWQKHQKKIANHNKCCNVCSKKGSSSHISSENVCLRHIPKTLCTSLHYSKWIIIQNNYSKWMCWPDYSKSSP